MSPWGKMTMLNMVESGRRPADADDCAVCYKCLGCLLCRSFCNHEISVPGALVAGRAIARDRGVAPESIGALGRRFDAHGNPFDEGPQEALRKLLDPEKFVEGAEAVYFAGCVNTLRRPARVTKFFAVAQALGVDYLGAWAGNPYCCGIPLYNAGLLREFNAHAMRLAQALNRYRLVVTPCPACAYALRGLYSEQGIQITAKVQHTAEFLLPLYEKRGPGSYKRRLAYHDPCYLGRYLGVYDEPRRALGRAGADVAEFQWNRDRAYCCGAGGALPLTSPDTAHAIADKRRDEFKKTGAEALVTACPSCEAMLARDGSGVEVLDLIDVLHATLL